MSAPRGIIWRGCAVCGAVQSGFKMQGARSRMGGGAARDRDAEEGKESDDEEDRGGKKRRGGIPWALVAIAVGK